jgi:hypothetical protein
MRWAGLFADLEAQAEALANAERAAEVEERTRGEIGALGLLDRARGAVGAHLRLRLDGGHAVTGRLVRVGADWLLLDDGAGREALVAIVGVISMRGLSRLSAVPGVAGPVESRLGLRQALRGVARDRSAVRLLLRDGTTVEATIDRVGVDFVEGAAHAPGEARRRQEVRDVELVPISALVAVRRAV